MTISRVCYVTRESVKRALDVKSTARADWQIDEAIQSATDSVEGFLHRTFYPVIDTRYWDWPNFQSAYPWRIWFDANELADVTVNVPVVTTGGNIIPNSDIFWGHPQYSPPYGYMELSRATSATFGQGDTPQRDVAITGTYGFNIQTAAAGNLASALPDTTSTYILVNSQCTVVSGVGDNILIDSERFIVTDKMMTDTGQVQQGSGLTTANTNDVTLQVTTGSDYSVNEVLLLDSESVLVTNISGNYLTVKRAWDGSVIAAHSGAEIYGLRTLVVERGALGTTAATHLDSEAVYVHVVPRLVAQLARAEAIEQLLGEQSGYAKQPSPGGSKGTTTTIGIGIDSIRDRAYTAFARQARQRVV